jgi:hypothetical protein
MRAGSTQFGVGDYIPCMKIVSDTIATPVVIRR